MHFLRHAVQIPKKMFAQSQKIVTLKIFLKKYSGIFPSEHVKCSFDNATDNFSLRISNKIFPSKCFYGH